MIDCLEKNMYDKNGNEIFRDKQPLQVTVQFNHFDSDMKEKVKQAMAAIGLSLKASSMKAEGYPVYFFGG